MVDEYFSLEDLGPLVASERKRRGLSLRDAAEDVEVPFNTLARVEKGHLPDLAKFKRLVEWVGADVSQFFERRDQVVSTPELVAQHLRKDPGLSGEAADHIASLVTDLYVALARPRQVTAAHLRAARTLKPEASQKLGSLLADLQEAVQGRGSGGTQEGV